MRITIKKKFVIFLKLFERISNFFFDISQSSIGHLLQNGSLKLNLTKLFLLFFITHTGGTPTPKYPFFDIPPRASMCNSYTPWIFLICSLCAIIKFSLNLH